MDVLHTYSFAVGRLDLLVSFCDYVTLVQPSGKAGLGRGRHDALAGAAEERPDLAASFTCELRHTHTVDVDGQRVRSRELEQIFDSLLDAHSNLRWGDTWSPTSERGAPCFSHSR